jgi:hypothetical protein
MAGMDDERFLPGLIDVAIGALWIVVVVTLAYRTVMRSIGRPARLPSRFSLRALLIGMTVVSI